MRVILVILSLTLIQACTSSKNKSVDTFVYCSEGSPTSFNPQITSDGASYNASSQPLYNRLVAFAPGTTEVIPSLAESWEVAEDGLTYTFKLKKGVQFHKTAYFTPTRDFNADDVIFTFSRPMDPNNPYHQISGGLYEYFNSMEMGKIIKAISKVDDYTVKFQLTRKEAPFVANLAMDFASILSKEYADQLLAKATPEKIDNEPIGTGPFVFKSYIKDTLIRYEGNPHYFEGAPKIKKLVIAITPDASVRYQKLKAGECHFVSESSPTDLAKMKTDKNLKVTQMPGLNVGYLAFNTQKAPFNNLDVRKAVYMALNRASYIKAIYLDNAELAKGPLPPVIWGYDANIKTFNYNMDEAKKLLTKAGFPNGFETELWTLPISRPYNPNGKKMGELMQADLAKVGIKVNLVTYDWPTYLAKIKKGEHKFIQYGWSGDNGDPDNFLGVLLSCASVEPGANASKWCNKEFSELIVKAKQVNDVGSRTQFYKKAQEIYAEEVPWVPLAHAISFKAMRENVYGYTQSPIGTENFYRVELR